MDASAARAGEDGVECRTKEHVRRRTPDGVVGAIRAAHPVTWCATARAAPGAVRVGGSETNASPHGSLPAAPAASAGTARSVPAGAVARPAAIAAIAGTAAAPPCAPTDSCSSIAVRRSANGSAVQAAIGPMSRGTVGGSVAHRVPTRPRERPFLRIAPRPAAPTRAKGARISGRVSWFVVLAVQPRLGRGTGRRVRLDSFLPASIAKFPFPRGVRPVFYQEGGQFLVLLKRIHPCAVFRPPRTEKLQKIGLRKGISLPRCCVGDLNRDHQQNVEKDPHLRSRCASPCDVRQRAHLSRRAPAAVLVDLFEHPDRQSQCHLSSGRGFGQPAIKVQVF